MVNSFKTLGCAAAALLGALAFSQAQTSAPEAAAGKASATAAQSPAFTAKAAANSPMLLVQAPAGAPAAPAPATVKTATTTTTEEQTVTESGGVGVREFQGDDVGQVLRLLARQAKINLVVSEAVTGTVTMRLEDVTAFQAIEIIVKAKGLFIDKIDSVYYVKTDTERAKEPTESDSYQFSYARAKDVAALIGSQLQSKEAPQIDERTNTIFFRETRSNIDKVRATLVQIDKPTRQVMIEARLVEVTANPKQSYGINWGGVLGSSTDPQKVGYSGTDQKRDPVTGQLIPDNFTLGNLENSHIFGNLSSSGGRSVRHSDCPANVGHVTPAQRRQRRRIPGQSASGDG